MKKLFLAFALLLSTTSYVLAQVGANDPFMSIPDKSIVTTLTDITIPADAGILIFENGKLSETYTYTSANWDRLRTLENACVLLMEDVNLHQERVIKAGTKIKLTEKTYLGGTNAIFELNYLATGNSKYIRGLTCFNGINYNTENATIDTAYANLNGIMTFTFSRPIIIHQ